MNIWFCETLKIFLLDIVWQICVEKRQTNTKPSFSRSVYGYRGGGVILLPCWFSLNNSETVKAVILVFSSI